MFQHCKERAALSKKYLILVCDKKCARLLNQLCITPIQLIRNHVYQIEDLTKLRKRYPLSDAIYFIAPESIDLVLKDFPAKDDIQYDQYGAVHLCFSSRVSDSDLHRLCKQEKLAERIVSLLDVNCNFSVIEDNIFGVSSPNVNFSKREDLINLISSQLLAICSTCVENKPYIQIQNSSKISSEVARSLNEKLKQVFNGKSSADDESNSNLMEGGPKRALVLIMDRSFDFCAPFARDWGYWHMAYDLYAEPHTLGMNEQGDNYDKVKK